MEKIGIFGGTFNPIHLSHVHMANIALKKYSLDKIFFVPTFISPFKLKRSALLGEYRIKMIENVMPKKCEISLFEINRNSVSYTINTIRYFAKKFPLAQLYLIIGFDHIDSLDKWQNIDQIAQMTNILAFKRHNVKIKNKANLKKYKIQVVEPILPLIHSSTNFKEGGFDQVALINRKYIAQNFLYLDDIAKNILSPRRYAHSKATAKLAYDYAKHYDQNGKHAYFAGLMHDITKEWPELKHRLYLQKNKVDDKKIPYNVLHQNTGALWLKNEYLLNNEEILKAISTHTTASIEMSTLDKIIFLADKLCNGRKFANIQYERKLVYENLDLAFGRAISRMEENLIARKLEIVEDFNKIIQKWKR